MSSTVQSGDLYVFHSYFSGDKYYIILHRRDARDFWNIYSISDDRFSCESERALLESNAWEKVA